MDIKETGYRWITLTLYSLSLGLNAMAFFTTSQNAYALSQVTLSQIYNLSESSIYEWLIYYMIASLVSSVPSIYVIDSINLRVAVNFIQILTGMLFTVIGAWIRVGVKDYQYLIIGSCVCAIGQPFLLNAIIKVSGLWFRPKMVNSKQRSIATNIGMISILLGFFFGFILSAEIVPSKAEDDVFILMIVEAVFCTVVFLLDIFFLKKKPMFPPSLTATQSRNGYTISLIEVFRNWSFFMVFISNSLTQGTLYIIVSYSQLCLDISISYDTYLPPIIIFGIAGNAILGFSTTKTLNYKLICIILYIISFFLYIICFSGIFGGISLFYPLFGISLFLTLSVSFEYGIELTFPVGEGMMGGILNIGGQTIGIIETTLLILSYDDNTCFFFYSNLISFFSVLLGLAALAFSRQFSKRSEIDKSISGYSSFISMDRI